MSEELRAPDGIEARIAGQAERVHILTGAVCNNNCIFCMEEDRDGRYETNSQTTDATVRWLAGLHKDTEEVCFTSGEPTTNPALPRWVKIARDQGVRRVSVMTNARALSSEPYLRKLLAAGMGRFYVSIHGHTAKLHESLTRTPESFDQTVAGIKNVARYKPRGIELHTSTVVTKRNLPHLGDIYRFLRGLGVDQVVWNVMQANGRANTFFEKIFPTYTEIATTAATFLREQRAVERESPKRSSSTSRCARRPRCPTSTAATSRSTRTTSRRARRASSSSRRRSSPRAGSRPTAGTTRRRRCA
jgi:MoaA/NifB/PqqE/SkfB family radical SAM enzyme